MGYAKVKGRWGIAISDYAGNSNHLEMERHEDWLFNDSPRAFRIEAVEKLPDLLKKLIEEADKTTDRIKDKTGQAKELADAITEISEPSRRKQ